MLNKEEMKALIKPSLSEIFAKSIVEDINKQCEENVSYTLLDYSFDEDGVFNISLHENKGVERIHLMLNILKPTNK